MNSKNSAPFLYYNKQSIRTGTEKHETVTETPLVWHHVIVSCVGRVRKIKLHYHCSWHQHISLHSPIRPTQRRRTWNSNFFWLRGRVSLTATEPESNDVWLLKMKYWKNIWVKKDGIHWSFVDVNGKWISSPVGCVFIRISRSLLCKYTIQYKSVWSIQGIRKQRWIEYGIPHIISP